MNQYNSFSDDFYVNMNLSTEMELSQGRETVLHFFEGLQKTYPTMRNFQSRGKADFILEQDKDGGQHRWATIEQRRVCSGMVNPPEIEDAMKQHRLVLELSPYLLALSPIDCESLDLLYGFDFTYRGNHNELIAEVMGVGSAMERMTDIPGSAVINYEPSITLALDENCRIQCRLSVESRTTAYQIRTGEFPEDQLSVYLTARQYGSLDAGVTYVAMLERLHEICEEFIDIYAAENVLEPLARAIAMK